MASHLKSRKKRATESDKSSSASALSRKSECGICLNDIVDQSEKSDGEDSVFCEGACKNGFTVLGWVSRTPLLR